MIIPILMLTFIIGAEVIWACRYKSRSRGVFATWTRGVPDPEKSKKLEADLAQKKRKGGPFINPIRAIREAFVGAEPKSPSRKSSPSKSLGRYSQESPIIDNANVACYNPNMAHFFENYATSQIAASIKSPRHRPSLPTVSESPDESVDDIESPVNTDQEEENTVENLEDLQWLDDEDQFKTKETSLDITKLSDIELGPDLKEVDIDNIYDANLGFKKRDSVEFQNKFNNNLEEDNQLDINDLNKDLSELNKSVLNIKKETSDGLNLPPLKSNSDVKVIRLDVDKTTANMMNK